MSSHNDLGILSTIDNHSLFGGFVAILVACFAFLRWLLGLAGARQDERIKLLETRVAQADNRSMALAQVVMALIPIVETSHPEHAALHQAREVLRKAFPADAPDYPET